LGKYLTKFKILGEILRKVKKQRMKPIKVCVMTFPSHWPTNRLFLSDLAKILEPICHTLHIITGNVPRELFSDKVHFIDVKAFVDTNHPIVSKGRPILISALLVLIIQIKMAFHLLMISRSVNIVIFYLAYFYQLPLLVAKILRKKTVLLQTNTISEEAMRSSALTPLSGRLAPSIMKANFSLADYIVPESEWLAREYGNYAKKVLLYGARFIDTTLFKIERPLSDRKNLVGYVGRLSFEKGIKNFVEAIPLILDKRSDIEILIVGDGPLFGEIEQKIRQYPKGKVSFAGWRPLEEIPGYLNELKVLVLPSYTEGLPTGILEAMACGTPVLSTPVGAVPDIVRDGETGFILPDNSPQRIARSIVTVLEHPNLNGITDNALRLVRQRYTYEAAVKRYRQILNKVAEKK